MYVHELVEVRRAVRDGIARTFRKFKRQYKLHGADAKLFLSIMPGMKPGMEVQKPTVENLLAEARERMAFAESTPGRNPLDSEYYSACGWDDMQADMRAASKDLVLSCYAAARSLGAPEQPDLDAYLDRVFLGV